MLDARTVMRRYSTCIVAATALAVLGGAPVCAARRRNAIVSAVVDGTRIRWRGRQVMLHSDDSRFVVSATNARATKTFGLACSIRLRGPDFPLIAACSANYGQRSRRRARYWFAPSGVDVTVDSFDGNVVEGRFSGALPALAFHGDGTTIRVRGTFRGPVRD